MSERHDTTEQGPADPLATTPDVVLALKQVNAPCGSCGEPTTHRIILRGKPVPACLRHTNVWRPPPADYTCPTRCVELNHPGQEHHDWLDEQVDMWSWDQR